VQTKVKVFFPNLDGLRFFSFLIVFFSHSFFTANEEIISQRWYQILKKDIFLDGDLGVSFFFVLSGFLITYLLLTEQKINSKIDVRRFYLRRILRIWPLYYFSVFFGFVIFPIFKKYFGQIPNESADPLLCSLFLNNFDRIINGPPDSSVLSVLWSVAIEEQFYLFWPLLFLLIPKGVYYLIFPAVVLISLCFRWQYPQDDIETHTLGVISDMALGGGLAYLSLSQTNFSRRISRMPRLFSLLPYFAALLLILYKYDIFISQQLVIFKRVIIGLIFGWILIDQCFNERCLLPVSKMKFATSLGRYTYGLYCLHTIALLIVVTILSIFDLDQHAWQLWVLQVPLALGLSILMSYISYWCFESPFLNIKKRFSYISI
jgi:peptidoglycan/LPS O-acetylase OafA/YrhL